ncbi:lytic transglycosylase domain-containing protein [Vibrio campbellii]|uniref:transglycosylase SLT domain-containing protein n=1 Tax=Vibrio campbellii TaxID=680 RepID=UPI00210D609D|nr:lytic transglycosylase domain-containing protein [Vibrio campbellii]UTZ44658.1 lytic transglycosylase domain-containing protein [Vibrio campbellii]
MKSFRSSNKTRWQRRFITAFGLSVFAFSPVQCWASVDKYDSQIKVAWRRYVPTYPWGLGWAQLWQESRLNPDAVSPVGAAGVGQFMPGTWSDMQKQGVVPEGVFPRDARFSIQAAAYYMRQNLDGWNVSGRTSGSRYDLAAAGYNAGRGHLYRAQKLCNGVMEYTGIIACLPDVTGRHSAETIDYVNKIHYWYEKRFGVSLWW